MVGLTLPPAGLHATDLPRLGPRELDPPRHRFGALPFPGPLTLFSLPDHRELGTASYRDKLFSFEADEVSRGILYTEKAGFLDLAHLRQAADWTRFLAIKVHAALRTGRHEFDLPHRDGSSFTVLLHYPDWWSSLSSDRRRAITSEAAIRIAQRLTLSILTWHEIVTWFGFRSTLIWSEKGSAFTYEDLMSHLVGVRIAGFTLRKTPENWERQVSEDLRNELLSLGVVSPIDTRRAALLVEGKWWLNGVVVRRMLDIGDASGFIRPWLVRGMPGGNQSASEFFLPDLQNVFGKDLTELYELRIRPRWRTPKRLRNLLPAQSPYVSPPKDFAPLLERIRFEVRFRFGSTADRPYEDSKHSVF